MSSREQNTVREKILALIDKEGARWDKDRMHMRSTRSLVRRTLRDLHDAIVALPEMAEEVSDD